MYIKKILEINICVCIYNFIIYDCIIYILCCKILKDLCKMERKMYVFKLYFL